MEKCAQPMLRLQFAQRGSVLETLDYFYEFQLVELHDDGQDFLGHLCQSQVPVVPESLGVSLPGDSAPGLPIRSFSCVDIGIAGSLICVKNNNNNTIWRGSVFNRARSLHPTLGS